MVRIYRWIVFLLAAGYCLRTLIVNDFAAFGGPFRFLTIWALFMSFACASRMIAREEGRTDRRWDGLVSATAVVNAMVVGLYWRLYLNDASSVTPDGQLAAPYLELYLHGLGPALQWIDATFIHRSFRRLGAAALWLTGIIGAYVLWSETLVQRFNDSPAGSVTSGLPYPFLNNLGGSDRAMFYAGNIVTAFVVLAVFAGVAWSVRRWLPAPPAPAGLRDSQGNAG